jgi:hypothetical protein
MKQKYSMLQPIHKSSVMTKNKTLFTIIGFLMFIFGFSTLVLMLVGMNLSFLTWIDAGGKLLGFVIRLLLIMSGFIFFYVAQSDYKGED